jgi:hypothetical protein
MPLSDPALVEEWVQKVFSLNQTYYNLIQAGLSQELGPPAPESEIADFETWLGYTLPPSYRTFISLHNGWRHWEGDTNLLSLQEMRQGPYAELVNIWKSEAWVEGLSVLLDGLMVAASLATPGGLILDTSRVDQRSEMEIVNWEYSEVTRYSDFVDLLQKTAQDLENLIAEEEAGET